MRGLRLCCKGIGCDLKIESAETKEKITVPIQREAYHKPREASVIPPKRKCVKNTVCSCFLQCLCDKCLNNNNTKPNTKPLYAQGRMSETSSRKPSHQIQGHTHNTESPQPAADSDTTLVTRMKGLKPVVLPKRGAVIKRVVNNFFSPPSTDSNSP